jgi:hypothetical protein
MCFPISTSNRECARIALAGPRISARWLAAPVGRRRSCGHWASLRSVVKGRAGNRMIRIRRTLENTSASSAAASAIGDNRCGSSSGRAAPPLRRQRPTRFAGIDGNEAAAWVGVAGAHRRSSLLAATPLSSRRKLTATNAGPPHVRDQDPRCKPRACGGPRRCGVASWPAWKVCRWHLHPARRRSLLLAQREHESARQRQGHQVSH